MEDQKFFDQLREMANAGLELWESPSVSVGVVKDGKVVFCEGFGSRDVARNLPANGETLYLLSASYGNYSRVCQTIQGYLLAAGINCELKLVDNAMFTSTLFDGTQYDMILVSAGGMTITNLWSNRFDMNAYANGDATGRRDETLTNMIYNTWTQAGFTDENITGVHDYLKENCVAYGLYIPWYDSVYRAASGISEAPVGASGAADFVASTFQ